MPPKYTSQSEDYESPQITNKTLASFLLSVDALWPYTHHVAITLILACIVQMDTLNSRIPTLITWELGDIMV